MNEDLKKSFIKEVHAAARSRYAVDVFADMVRAMSIAIEVSTHIGSTDALEKEYAAIREKYEPDEFQHFFQAFAIVMAALERAREAVDIHQHTDQAVALVPVRILQSAAVKGAKLLTSRLIRAQ